MILQPTSQIGHHHNDVINITVTREFSKSPVRKWIFQKWSFSKMWIFSQNLDFFIRNIFEYMRN